LIAKAPKKKDVAAEAENDPDSAEEDAVGDAT